MTGVFASYVRGGRGARLQVPARGPTGGSGNLAGRFADLLVDVLPMRASEQAAKASGQRGPFIVRHIDLDDWGTSRRRQRRCFVVGERAADHRGGDLSDLISVHEAQSMPRPYGDAIEEIQLGNLKDVMNLAELRPTGANHGRTSAKAS